MVLAFIYTTPWDNYLVKTQVWSYPPDRVLGRIGYVPLEEYSFFIFQTYLTGLWCYFVIQKWKISSVPDENLTFKWAGAIILLGLWLFGFSQIGRAHFEYLSLILVWAIPVILLQWTVGANYFRNNFLSFIMTLIPVTFYLIVCDGLAIHWGIWHISPEQTLGWNIFGLPIEECIFFLVTNVMVAMGLIFFLAMEKHFPIFYGRIVKRKVL